MNNDPPVWRYLGKSVRGAFHGRSGLPNQDAIGWFPDGAPGEASRLIMAVSDGHGSRKNFRSDQGSKFAVETAIRVIQREFFSEEKLQKPLITAEMSDSRARLIDLVNNNLLRKLVYEWSTTVEEHWKQHPLTPEEQQEWQRVEAEWQKVQAKEPPDLPKKTHEPSVIPYGATLIAVLITESFILYLQLGDGDILCVDSSGKVTRPLAHDDRLIANETTSLCTPNAWRDFRVAFQFHDLTVPDTIPALILLSTDGYANSFSSEADFKEIGPDYRDMIHSSGLKKVGEALEGYLQDASEQGSGDDITLGLIKRLESENDRDYIFMKTRKLDQQVQEVMQGYQTYQKKIDKSINLLKIGLLGTSALALLSIGLCGWLFNRVSLLEQSLQTNNEQIEQQNNQPQQPDVPSSPSPTENTANGAENSDQSSDPDPDSSPAPAAPNEGTQDGANS